MATRCLSRSLLTKLSLSTTAPRLSLSTTTTTSSAFSLLRLRSISTATFTALRHLPPAASLRGFSTRPTSSSLADPHPNWSNRPPKETILLDGCDFEHWLVVVDKPEGEPTRDEIIDSYIKTLSSVIGSEDEARMKIYSVSTRCYYAFGCLVSEELSYKLKELPKVRWVLPDSYLDVRNKDYGGEPFINGQAVPYDPKYHEEWIRNNARAGERNRRNDRPRNSDRSRNFERRRENMQGRDFQNRGPPTNSAPNMGGMPQNPGPNMGGMPQNPGPNMGGMPPQNNMGGIPPQNNMGGMPPQNNMGGMPPQNNMGGMPPQNNMGGMPPQNNMGGMPGNNMGGATPNYGMSPNNMGGGMAPNNMRGMPPNNMGGMPAGNIPNYQNSGAMPPPGQVPNREYQNSYAPNMGGMPGAPYQR